jgi:hypothetical protein
MVGFFAGRMQQMIAVRRISSQRRLAQIQRLRTDLTGVIDPHQAGHVAALCVIDIGFLDTEGGRRSLGGGCAGDGLDCALAAGQQAVERCQGADVHAQSSSSCCAGRLTGVL